MVKQTLDRMTLLSLLEASQTAVESSDKALSAAEEALAAAQAANIQAKEVLRAVSEAFVSERNSEPDENGTNRTRSITMDCASDEESDGLRDFVMLSDNKNPVDDIEDDSSQDDYKEDTTSPNFLLISSTGPAADHHCMLGLYRRAENGSGRSVYLQEHSKEYGDSPYLLFQADDGFWAVMSMSARMGGKVHPLLRTLKPSPTSVTWQYYDRDKNQFIDDHTVTVTSLSERPSCECELTLSLSETIARDIKDSGVAGVYSPDGRYHEGRPVFRHSGGHFVMYVSNGQWGVAYDSGVGGYEDHLLSLTAPGPCPADHWANLATVDDENDNSYWGYKKNRGGWTQSSEISFTCRKHNILQIVDVCEEGQKDQKMARLLEETCGKYSTKIVVFVETKKKADELTRLMRQDGWPALCIHGDKQQRERNWVLGEFTNGSINILVATNVVARSLDVDDVKFVINYDYPNNIEDYIHRISRTGRRGNTGTSYTLFTPGNATKAKDLVSFLSKANQHVNPKLTELVGLSGRYGGDGGGGRGGIGDGGGG